MDTKTHEKKLLTGALWTSLARWCVKIIGLFSTIILVRILSPSDFGMIVKVLLIMGPLENIAQIGFAETLLQNKRPTLSHYQTALTLNIILCSVLTFFLIITAGFWADIMRQPELIFLLPIMSLKIFFTGFINPRTRELQRDFAYKQDLLLLVLLKISAVLLTLGIVLYRPDYVGLAIGQTLGIGAYIIISYFFLPFIPKFSLKHSKEFFDFSLSNMRAGTSDYILQHLDSLLLARYVNTHILGIYNLAYQLAEQFTTEIIYPLARAFFPVFSDIKQDSEKLKNVYLTSLSFLFPLCLAIGGGLAMVASPFIHIYAGKQWYETISLLQLLAMSSAAQAFCLVNSSVLGATGHIKQRATLTTLHAILSALCMIPFAIKGDVVHVLYVKLIFGLCFMIANIGVVKSVLNIPLKSIISIIYRPIISIFVMVLTLYVMPQMNNMLALGVDVIVGMITFTATLMILWYITGKNDGAEKIVFHFIKNKL